MRWMPIGLLVIAAMAATVARNAWVRPPSAARSVDPAAASGEPEPWARIFAGGIVEGSHRELSLRFEVPGRVKAVHVRPGTAVKAGDVLAELESDVAELTLSEAGLRLKIAIAERDQSVADARRLAQHRARDVVPAADQQPRTGAGNARSQSDRSAEQWRSAAASTDSPLSHEEQVIADGKVALADAEVRRARIMLDKLRLRAPRDGIVLRATYEPGELTGPTDAESLLTFVDHGVTRVRAFVEELDAQRVQPGQLAVVSTSGTPDHPYSGVVCECSPDVRSKSHRHSKPGERLDVRVREVLVELDDGADLLIGLPVEVFIDPSFPADEERPDDGSPSSGAVVPAQSRNRAPRTGR